MTDNFQQTVNLKDKITAKRPINPADRIERVYAGKKDDFQKISRPVPQKFRLNEKQVKAGLIALAIVLATSITWGLFFNGKKGEAGAPSERWYAVKLINGEVFYGLAANEDAFKLTLEKVYYNYDQLKDGTVAETVTGGNLRLIKLGNEAYGPEGTREILQDKVIYKDLLKDDSKVLKAILEYEK